jgi:aryl-alcohol dehydrogenase-like predicted oxidoreductase
VRGGPFRLKAEATEMEWFASAFNRELRFDPVASALRRKETLARNPAPPIFRLKADATASAGERKGEAHYDRRMQYRPFGRTGWNVSEIGYGMWGMAGWTGSDDEESRASLDRAVDLGCNFFDTAWAYGEGRSEQLLGELLKRHPGKRLYTATKIPPKNRKWPARSDYALDEVFPADHIREYTERSLRNLDVATIDLQQFHVWTDAWASDERWQRAVSALKTEGLVRAIGISINRWQPANVLEALRTDLIDSVQVVYNIFDQAPEDELFPECRRRNIAVIARVPFDEGSLTGSLTADTKWPEGDFRNIYFQPDNLRQTIERVEALRQILAGPQSRDRRARDSANATEHGTAASARGAESTMPLPELALRFILQEPTVGTVIPGMRKLKNVDANLRTSDGRRLPDDLMRELRRHRWDRWIDIP